MVSTVSSTRCSPIHYPRLIGNAAAGKPARKRENRTCDPPYTHRLLHSSKKANLLFLCNLEGSIFFFPRVSGLRAGVHLPYFSFYLLQANQSPHAHPRDAIKRILFLYSSGLSKSSWISKMCFSSRTDDPPLPYHPLFHAHT